jgi:hypothetical protein
VPNTVNKDFKDRGKLEVVVSDLTYVRVNKNRLIYAHYLIYIIERSYDKVRDLIEMLTT